MWSAIRATGQRTYYVNNQTQETTWEKPVELFTPQDHALANTPWKEYETDDGKVYWYNDDTKESTWEFPLQLSNSTPQQEFEKACVDAGLLEGTLQEAVPLLIRYDFYFKIPLQERINLFNELREQHSGDGGRDKHSSQGGEVKNQNKAPAIDPLDYRRQVWKENNPLPQFLNDESFPDGLRASIEKHHKAEMQRLKDEVNQCHKKAALARIQFLDKLEKLRINEKTAWLDVADKLEPEIIALTPHPGSTPVDLFFWYRENRSTTSEAYRMDLKRLKSEALDALSKHNKNITHVTQTEFAELTGVENVGVYEELKNGYYWLQQHKRNRERQEIDDLDAPKRKEVALEY